MRESVLPLSWAEKWNFPRKIVFKSLIHYGWLCVSLFSLQFLFEVLKKYGTLILQYLWKGKGKWKHALCWRFSRNLMLFIQFVFLLSRNIINLAEIAKLTTCKESREKYFTCDIFFLTPITNIIFQANSGFAFATLSASQPLYAITQARKDNRKDNFPPYSPYCYGNHSQVYIVASSVFRG